MAFNYDEITNGNKVYIIAEMSANHSNDINIAKKINITYLIKYL